MFLLYFSLRQPIADCLDGVTQGGAKGSSRSKRGWQCLVRRKSASSAAERGKVLLLPKKPTGVGYLCEQQVLREV